MSKLILFWNWISSNGSHELSDQDKRTVAILNRINFFLIGSSLIAYIATVLSLLIKSEKAFGIGSLRLMLILISGLFSFYLTAKRKYTTAKILVTILSPYFLIIFPTLFHQISIEYYFYYPMAAITMAIVPLLLFPQRNERRILILLVSFCFFLALFSDNLLSWFSTGEIYPYFLSGRYFFYKLSQALIFIFIIFTVFTLKELNIKYETKLATLNQNLLNINNELEEYKDHLENLVESKTSALIESESKFRNLFENANDVIFIIKDGAIVDCNLRTTQMFGLEKEQIIGKTPDALSPKYQADGRESSVSAVEKIRWALMGETLRFEWTHLRSDGNSFDTEVSLNNMDLNGFNYLLAVVRDITERKNVEEALKQSESKFRSVYEKSKQPIIIVDNDARIFMANNAFTELSGYVLDKPIPLTDLMLPGQQKQVRERLNAIKQNLQIGSGEWKVRFSNGKFRIVESNSSLMDYNGETVFLILLRDVTDLRNAEQKIMEAVINTEETERSRISQDLHDGLGPVLSTIKIYFQVYRDSQDDLQKTLLMDKLKNTIDEAIREVSEISHNISPHVLRNYGFYAAIKQFAHEISLTRVVHIGLECEKETELNENSGITLYRAITELINNSVKHSGCSNIAIKFHEVNGNLQIHYTDNGSGFSVESVTQRPGHGSGLRNILTRIQALRGQASINSEPGKGMEALLTIPVKFQ